MDRIKYEKRSFLLYMIVCNETGMFYCDILYNWSKRAYYALSADKKELVDCTIKKPKKYMKTCPQLYQDIMYFGCEAFDIRKLKFEKDEEKILKYMDWYVNGFNKANCYNNLVEPEEVKECSKQVENKPTTGIMCVETGVVYPTPGKAAKAVGLKDKSSIIKVLDRADRTAAKYHWKKLVPDKKPQVTADVEKPLSF